MAKPTARYFQKCDFCHKEFETNAKGMPSIELPGYYIENGGGKIHSIVSGTMCSECTERLRDSLREFIDLKEVEYIGNVFSWNERKDENNG